MRERYLHEHTDDRDRDDNGEEERNGEYTDE